MGSYLSTSDIYTKQYMVEIESDNILSIKDGYTEYDTVHLVDYLAKGTFGSVYKGLSTKHNKLVAVKEIHLDDLDDIHKRRLDNELYILGKITNEKICEEHLLCIYYYGKSARTIYIVSELIDGKDLFDLLLDEKSDLITDGKLNDKGKVLASEAIRKVVNSVSILHKNNIVHGDIKLENIMYDFKTDRIKLIDYGFSCLSTPNDNHSCFESSGTVEYMAPEVIRAITTKNNDVSTKESDIWSLGIVIIFLLLISVGKDQNIIDYINDVDRYYKDQIKHPSNFLENKVKFYLRDLRDGELKTLVLGMCQTKPKNRYVIKYVMTEIRNIIFKI